MPWDGHTAALASYLETIPHQYKYGKHPDFRHTLRLTREKKNTPYISEETTTESVEDDRIVVIK
jgi:hypothetical protein